TPDLYRSVGVRTVPDALPGRRSLVGIYTGVLHVGGPAFVCACDMPFLNPPLIRYLGALADGVDVVIPQHDGEFEPLHAVHTPGRTRRSPRPGAPSGPARSARWPRRQARQYARWTLRGRSMPG